MPSIGQQAYAQAMWGHEYDAIKRAQRLRVLRWALVLIILLALLAIPVSTYFELSRADRQLLSAARSGDIARAERALATGANPNIVSRRGQTALHVAAWHGRPGVARTLIRARADVNARGGRAGETPLHTAARANQPEMVILLLGAGARTSLRTLGESDPDIRGNRHPAGMTAGEIAAAAGFDGVSRLLPGTRREYPDPQP